MIAKPYSMPLLRIPIVLAALSLPLPSRAWAMHATEETDREEAVIGWLRRGAVPLQSVKPGAGFEDLKPLRTIVQGARVIGFGEATHGTREFVQLRHRLLEFLVQEMGFTVLAVEFSAADGLLVDDYVSHGHASRKQMGACLEKNWITNIEELLAVIDWMREYNGRTSVEKRVKFMGIDPQANARGLSVVRNYLRKTAGAKLSNLEDLFGALGEQDTNALHFAPTRVTTQQVAELHNLLSYFVLNRASLVRQSSKVEWQGAVDHLRWLTQFAEFNSPASSRGGGTRDGYMAENFLALVGRERPGTRFALWAHNAHICKRDTGSFPALGSYLGKAFGNEFYAFGLSFDRGSFRAQLPRQQPPKQKVFSLGSATAGTIDWFMSKVGIGNFAVDLRARTTDARIADWLKTPHSLHWAGAFFSDDGSAAVSTRPFLLSRDFDGLIFVESSSPSRPLSSTGS
jgi:erythromycin esterase